jgi:pyruvate kinase
VRGEVNYENMLAAPASTCSRTHRQPGQRIVVTAGVPFHVRGTTNMLRIEEL